MDNIKDLVNLLKRASDAYYNSDEVIISNDTYDSLVESLKRMDPSNPYLKEVGSSPRSGVSKLGRVIPMGTLSKYHTEDEVKEWLSNENSSVILAPKYDGFGVELIYNNGVLVMASTRGTGYVGEDVMEAVTRIPNVPTHLPISYSDLEIVRGEAIIPRANHDNVKALGYSAMRNAVPGIVRSNREEALCYVEFVAYEFFDGTNDRISQRIKYSNVFKVEDFTEFDSNDFEGISVMRNHYGKIKDSYEYEIDGMVLKTNAIREDELMCPTHQIAWKFKSNRKETILRGIEFQLGVTGKYNPVAKFDEVEFQGAKLTSASLGSMYRYYEMKPCIGDVIEVSRRGDIIPFVEDIVTENGGEFIEMTHCIHCGEPLNEEYKCVNKRCPEKLKLQIIQYVGSVGVKGIGPSLVRGLIESGAIKTLSDVYKVSDEDILKVPRQGQASVEKWHNLVEKELHVNKFLASLPFDNVGQKMCDTLLDNWFFNEIMNLTADDIKKANLKGIGESKINNFIDQLSLYKDEILEMYSLANIR